MRHEENRFVSKSFEDQFLEYIRTDVCVNRAQRIIEKVNVPEMIDTIVVFNLTTQFIYLSKRKWQRFYIPIGIICSRERNPLLLSSG